MAKQAKPKLTKTATKKPAADKTQNQQLDPAVMEKLAELRTRVHETFGKVALALLAVPRYRHLSLGDLQSVILEPLMNDRLAMAQPAKEDGPQLASMAGIAIWASVSEEVDAKIREQIKAGVFPVKMKPEDWKSGEINWLFDVIAPNQRLATAVIANFKQVIKTGDLRIHPLVTKLVEPEALNKMGASPVSSKAADIKVDTTSKPN